ncbi:hypothetical protein BGW39_000706 [Mortierella sp. 14UC]|nr:hypothetical protein BGW39_000706 [Mortierella sp. 14UC]
MAFLVDGIRAPSILSALFARQHDDNIDIGALTALARTNKRLSSTALAFLYKDPFGLAALTHNRYGFVKDDVIGAGFSLTRMLLRCQPAVVAADFPTYLSMALRISETYAPPSNGDDGDQDKEKDDEEMEEENIGNTFDAVSQNVEEDFMRAVSAISSGAVDDLGDMDISDGRSVEELLEEPDVEQDMPPTSQDYLSYIRYLNMEIWAIDMEMIWPYRGVCQYPVGFEDYVARSHANELQHDPHFRRSLRKYYHTLLYQEAVWALANPILEQLQSLYIPVSDTRRYLNAISRLSRLEDVQFILKCARAERPRYSEEKKAAVTYKEETLKLMLEFVQEHARLFPALLKSATFSKGGFWTDLAGGCREATELKIFRILPPVAKLTSLTRSSLPAYLAHPFSTDLSHVKEIILGSKDRVDDLIGILQRCPSLKALNIDALGTGSFKWAVEAKRKAEAK